MSEIIKAALPVYEKMLREAEAEAAATPVSGVGYFNLNVVSSFSASINLAYLEAQVKVAAISYSIAVLRQTLKAVEADEEKGYDTV